ncbi:MAG: hypothetical protein A2133_07270 [Actinobacteria bacterium RBG_16_64_13]|nr:MAG: hypothetical protein A2133_07270 [Actinobacteria bacterium RBG_16_64_13]
MSAYESTRREIEQKSAKVREALFEHISEGGRLVVVKAPPGSGKTHLLLESVAHARSKRKLRAAIACQTNTQADDICKRLARDYPDVEVVRFAAGGSSPVDFGSNIIWETKTDDLPLGPCVVVSTSAKWGLVNIRTPFDVLFVDEAWQMAWKDFMLLGQVAGRFVLIGDPGQIPPVVTIEVKRWETSPRPPHRPTPEVILASPELEPLLLELPATRRLPHDSAQLIQTFYDFPFGSFSGPGERAVLTDRKGSAGIDRALNLLAETSAVGLTLPTPDGGPPMEKDDALAKVAVDVVKRLLDAAPRLQCSGKSEPIAPEHVGISATHRVMNTAIDLALPRRLRGVVQVDTPERWQGLERPVMIAIHPLSGVISPSEFSLETGRMCVMVSRHQGGLIVLSRDHVADTLEEFIPSATQAVGRADLTGRGHVVHREFWGSLGATDRIIPV